MIFINIKSRLATGLAIGIITSISPIVSFANINHNETRILFSLQDEATDAVTAAEASRNVTDIQTAREKVNTLPESASKDALQSRLNAISPNLTMDKLTSTANVDMYIKSENMLSMSLDTNSITFEDFSGVSDLEKTNAVTVTVNSSLPYELNAYLPEEIQNADKSKTMDKSILNIKANSESSYKTFSATNTKLNLLDNQPAGNNLTHGLDLKLKGGLAYQKDNYKATVKLEINQK